MRCNATEMKDAEKRIRDFIHKFEARPNYALMTDMDTGKDVKMLPNQYSGMFYNNYLFWMKNGRYPNYVTYVLDKSSPMILNFQDNKYNCCPASLSMCSTKLFNPRSEGELAKLLGTGTGGTSPTSLVNNSPKVGLTVKAISRNPTAVATELNKYRAVMAHYQTKPATCGGWVYDYGHYCVITSVNKGYYTIYDPTKGVFTCPTGILDKATEGRAIYYYSVKV